MNERPAIWSKWAQSLQRFKLDGLAALMLDAAGPLNILLAQLVYLGQPLLGSAGRLTGWQSLAQMLEQPEMSRQFAAFLQQESRHS